MAARSKEWVCGRSCWVGEFESRRRHGCVLKSVVGFFVIKRTRCTNFTNLFCHETLRVSDSSFAHHQEFIHCILSNVMSYRFVDSFRAGPGHSGPARKLSTDIYHCWVYSELTPDDGQRNCPKHVEFHAKNKSAKLVHLVGFIIKKFVTMHGHTNGKKKALIYKQ